MRRLPVLVVALLAVTASIVGGSAATAATSAKLTVTTLGREGTKVTSALTLVNMSNAFTYQETSGKQFTLPTGTYSILVDIWNSADDTDTVAAKDIKVTGTTSTTIDARAGKLVNIKLDTSPGAGYSQQIDARVCEGWNATSVDGYNAPGHLYVVPYVSNYIKFAYMSEWRPDTGTGDVYAVSSVMTGIPAAPSATYHVAQLATVQVQAMNGPQDAPTADLSMSPDGGSSGCQTGMFDGETYTGQTPYTVTAHLSAGTWGVGVNTQADDGSIVGNWGKIAKLAAATSYRYPFYHSVWGPAHILPYVMNDVTPERLIFDPMDMFGDPYMNGDDAAIWATTTLSLNGKTIASVNGTDWGGGSDGDVLDTHVTTSGWYTLNTTATRYHPGLTFPATMLSTKSSVSFHYYVSTKTPQVAPVFLTRFFPYGMNMDNQAAPSSTTLVGLTMDRSTPTVDTVLHADTVKTVAGWWSSDDGATWHSTAVTHTGSTYSMNVPNPASGMISLRSEVTDPSGNSSIVTVYRAYAIG